MLKQVPLAQIKENLVALRTVNLKGEGFLGLVKSIQEKGFVGALTVRAKTEAETGDQYYELIDGLHRYTACKELGLENINVDILDADDAQTLELQLMSNFHKIETKGAEYSRQLKRILNMNPLMTEAELAKNLGVSTKLIRDRLSINKIDNEQVLELINVGDICMTNAYQLAKLPPDELAEYTDRAMTMTPDEFVPLVTARCKEIRDAAKAGKQAAAETFVPVAHMQKLTDIKAEQADSKIRPQLCKGLKTAEDGFKMALNWVTHMDPMSVDVQKSDWEARQRKKAEATAKRKADSEAKKAAKLAKQADEAATAAAKAKEAVPTK